MDEKPWKTVDNDFGPGKFAKDSETLSRAMKSFEKLQQLAKAIENWNEVL